MATSGLVTVTVLAANGQQSSAVVTHLLSLGSVFNDSFRLRAVVRDPSKYSIPNAGNQVIEAAAGDMNNTSSLEKAFEGTDVLWAMTNPNPALGMDGEIQSGRNIVDAFVRAVNNREHDGPKPLLLLSSAIDVEAVTKGEIRMVNATAKAKIESYIHALPANELQKFRFTFVHPGMFMQNFVTYQKPVADQDGVHHFSAAVRPDAQLPFVDITDLGPLVWHLIRTAYSPASSGDAYDEYDRATIRLWGELLSYPQLVQQFTLATGNDTTYDLVSVGQFLSATFGITEQEAKAHMDSRTRKMEDETVATMIGDMYNLINRYGYYGGGNEEDDSKDIRTKKLILQQPSKKTSWVEFVNKNFVGSQMTTMTTTTNTSNAVLNAPSSIPPSSRNPRAAVKALNFLSYWFSYFINGSSNKDQNPNQPSDFEQAILQPYFHANAVVEFPYFPKPLRQTMGLKQLSADPDEDGAILEGHDDILAYFKDWRKMFYFEQGDLHSMYTLMSDSSTTTTTTTPSPILLGRSLPPTAEGGAVMEMRLKGTVTHDDGNTKPYVQDYVSFAYADADGKIVRYQEYWAANRF